MPLPHPTGRPIIGIEPILWCEADYGTYQLSSGSTLAVADGDPVGYCTDRSVFGNHLIQATTTKRATLKTNIINGYPVLRFDGTDDVLATAAFAGQLNQPNTIFVVARPVSVGVYNFFTDGISGSLRHAVYCTSGGKFSQYAGTGSDPDLGTLSANTWKILTSQFNGASSFGRVNGTQSSTLDTGSQALTGLKVGDSATGGNYAAMDIAAVLVYPGVLTSAQITQVETYLNNKYQVY